MAGNVLYDWLASRNLSDWKLEGRGELRMTADDGIAQPEDAGALQIRTFHCGPGRKATNVWLHGLSLPDAFEVEWTFRSPAAAGNCMLIFNALPLRLRHLFEDPRSDARYCELASYGKIVCHTVGYHRGVYGRPSVLRTIGGHVPEDWAEAEYPSAAWQEMNKVTVMHETKEPLGADDLGKPHRFKLERDPDGARFYVNETQIHNWVFAGAYPYYDQPLRGGRMAFRNFGGYADDYFRSLVVRAL